MLVRSSGKIQAPALGGGHEISHAAEHDRIGTDQFQKSLKVPGTVTYGPNNEVTFDAGVSVEEGRATNMESQMARDLKADDQIRRSHNDHGGEVTTCGPTSTEQCQNI